MTPSRIPVDERTRVLVLTGAGVSAESGIPTFRGSSGLWENHPVEEVASPDGFEANPALVWRFYSERRQKALTCEPNPGHRALAELETRLGDRFLLATQNVDGLHRKAGSKRMIEMHGHLFTTRCSACDRPPFLDEKLYDEPPRCDACGGLLRPHIVWFGEELDQEDLDRIGEFMTAARDDGAPWYFLAVGTSGAVYPAAGLVALAKRAGAQTWLVNADPPENAGWFDHFVQGKSGEILPALLARG